MNIPGIFKIEKIAASSVDLPSLLSGKTIILEDYLTDDLTDVDFITDTSLISVESKKNQAGPYFEIEVPFKITGYDSTILEDLKNMNARPHVYIVTEKSGLKYLVGFNYDPKTTFEYKLANDADGKGGRTTECKIKWKTTQFPVFVE